MAGEHLWLRVANLVDEEGCEATIKPWPTRMDISKLLDMKVDIEPLILEAWAERVKEAVYRDTEEILYGNLNPRSRVYLGVMRA